MGIVLHNCKETTKDLELFINISEISKSKISIELSTIFGKKELFKSEIKDK